MFTIKKLILLTLAISLLAGAAWSKDYTVSPSTSQLQWFASKITGKHDGAVSLKKGDLKIESGKLKSGKIMIDMSTITVSDIEDPKYNAKLQGHLESADFFDVAKFKTAIITVKSVKALKGTQIQVKANLMIKGYIKEIDFKADLSPAAKGFKLVADIEIDRTLWDIRYGSSSFFKGLGDKAIHNEIKFKVDLDLIEKK